ncbi:MAG: hypothetical protein ACRENA_16205 [Vulcanimicrobiaceae bacterium]
MIFRSVVFTVGLALGAAAQALAQLATPSPEPQVPPATSTPSVAPSVSPVETPAPTPTPLPTFSPAPLPTTTPTPSPTPTPVNPYKYVVEPTPDPSASPGAPQIIRIEIIDKTIHVGGQFACRITTTPNVSSLVMSAEGRDIQIPKAQDGVFAGIQKIPGFIPPWFLKTYQVTFNAMTPDGQKATASLPLTLAY